MLCDSISGEEAWGRVEDTLGAYAGDLPAGPPYSTVRRYVVPFAPHLAILTSIEGDDLGFGSFEAVRASVFWTCL